MIKAGRHKGNEVCATCLAACSSNMAAIMCSRRAHNGHVRWANLDWSSKLAVKRDVSQLVKRDVPSRRDGFLDT